VRILVGTMDENMELEMYKLPGERAMTRLECREKKIDN
jgi:hypothetical protein